MRPGQAGLLRGIREGPSREFPGQLSAAWAAGLRRLLRGLPSSQLQETLPGAAPRARPFPHAGLPRSRRMGTDGPVIAQVLRCDVAALYWRQERASLSLGLRPLLCLVQKNLERALPLPAAFVLGATAQPEASF